MVHIRDSHDERTPRHELPTWLPTLVFAVAALCAVLPLIVNGCSCGHDFDFHLLSWMEAAHQWQHGVLKPVWAFTAAYNAGEPRLLFYPPLSWMTGAALGMLLPWPAVPAAFTALVLFLSGLSMQRLLCRWTTPTVAMLGGCLYLLNPYMLFVGYERTAYAELLAAAWTPLLLAALLRDRVTVWRVALPVALLWLTNAPAAVLGCYAVLLLGLLRLILMFGADAMARLRVAAVLAAGVLLGGLLDSFYLLPLLVERRYISLDLAVVPIARPDHNFLFQWDKDVFHTHVLVQASYIAIGLCATGVLCGTVLLLLKPVPVVAFGSMHARDTRHVGFSRRNATLALLLFLAVVFFLLTRWSLPFWQVGPELVYAQFPWRFLVVAAAAAVALLASLLDRVASRLPLAAVLPAAALTALLVGWFAAGQYFREECGDDETVAVQRTQFQNEKGVDVTDEYTPANDDNGDLPTAAPPAWIASEANEEPGKHPLLPEHTHPAPETFQFVVPPQRESALLVVRLRQFPGWHTRRDGVELHPGQRSDGLIVVPLPAHSPHQVDLVYRTTWDQWLGAGLSGTVLAASAWAVRRRRSGTMDVPR